MDINLESVLPLMIPLVAIVMGIGYAMLSTWLRYQRRKEIYELHHRERMLAIERGMEVPPLPPEAFLGVDLHHAATVVELAGQRGYRWRNPLRRALVWMFGGAALMVALYLNHRAATAAWALIPIAMGLANLIFYLSQRRADPAWPDTAQAEARPGDAGSTRL